MSDTAVPARRFSVVVVAMVAAGVLFALATRQGIGLFNDSPNFLRPALALWRGEPFESIHFPPLVPWTVWLLAHATGGDVLAAAWLLQGISLVALVAIVGAMCGWSACGHPAIAAGMGALLIATSPVCVGNAVIVNSDLCGAMLSIAALGALARSVVAQELARRWLVIAIGAAALALLARFAAFSVALTIGVVVWLRRMRPLSRDFFTALAAGAGAVLPCFLHVLHNALAHQNATNREFGMKGLPFDRIDDALVAVAHWFLPDAVGGIWSGLLIIGVAAGSWLLGRHRIRGKPAGIMLAVLFTFVTVNGAFLLLSISFIDFWTPLDGRILLPALVATAVIVVVSATLWVARWPALRWPVLAGCGILVAATAWRGWKLAGLYARDGVEQRRVTLQQSQLAGYLRGRNTVDTLILTNNPSMLWNMTMRESRAVPAKFDPIANVPRPEFAGELAMAQQTFRDTPQALFVVMPEPDNPDRASPEEFLAAVPHQRVLDDGIVVIYVPAPRSRPPDPSP